jgi:hypothetical protein
VKDGHSSISKHPKNGSALGFEGRLRSGAADNLHGSKLRLMNAENPDKATPERRQNEE